MIKKTILILLLVLFAVTSVAADGNKIQGKTQEKTGEPYRYQEQYAHPPATFCYPQPTIIGLSDNILKVYFRGQGFSIDEVLTDSVFVQGKIPPYTGVRREGRWLVTDCFIFRFLGSSGFRPIPPEGIKAKYTVEFDLISGEHIVLEGDYELVVIHGDMTLDGQVNADDVIFMSEYFWHGGPACEVEEFMDLNWDGVIDPRDLALLIEIVGI
ncbi:MAG: hypothetical protein JSU74_08555 [Candidatus Zixiibacteriota bacterium]|nr:MAG: hypothetical protein JSU74_08555 [candidate division Zixibacteria bacterium]